MTATLRFSWLEAQPSRTRLALALAADGALAGVAMEASNRIFLPASPLTNLWLAIALTVGGLGIAFGRVISRSAGLFGEGSRRRRLLGGVLVLLYSALVNEVAGAPLPFAFVLAFSAGFIWRP